MECIYVRQAQALGLGHAVLCGQRLVGNEPFAVLLADDLMIGNPPILKAKKALADMASGDVLKVVATDPGSVRDFQAFARQTGNELIEQTSANDEFVHYLRRR
jgi:UTP-glucose-1-phosphate uridylyltransferase